MDVCYTFECLNRIKDTLNRKGLDTLRIMGKTFRKQNSYDGFNKICKEELHNVLRELNLNLQQSDIEVKKKLKILIT